MRTEEQRSYQREWMRRRRQNPLHRRADIEQTRKWQRANPAHNSWIQTKRSAKQRGHEWNLERAEFDRLVLANCFYCGAMPDPVNGVDRIDNNLGYIANNVTTACQHCNYAKRKMSMIEFISWARRLVAHIDL